MSALPATARPADAHTDDDIPDAITDTHAASHDRAAADADAHAAGAHERSPVSPPASSAAARFARGEPPFDASERYAKASPWLAADRIHRPVLLITADMDFVTTSQSERMFSALSRLGQQARLVTYWGEEHFNWSPANIRDLYGQIFDWLKTTLCAEDITVTKPRTVDSTP